jgi:hypothetical protein
LLPSTIMVQGTYWGHWQVLCTYQHDREVDSISAISNSDSDAAKKTVTIPKPRGDIRKISAETILQNFRMSDLHSFKLLASGCQCASEHRGTFPADIFLLHTPVNAGYIYTSMRIYLDFGTCVMGSAKLEAVLYIESHETGV